MKRTHIFEAEDGTTFDSAAECKRHEEREQFIKILSDLTTEDVRNAIDRADMVLADAIERAGNIIAAKRRESGELRRKTAKSMADIPASMDNANDP